MSQLEFPLLRDALVAAAIAGPHMSHPRYGSIQKIFSLVEGEDEDATFGLSGLERYSASEILGFMAQFTGCPDDIANVDCDDFIDPDLTIDGIMRAARRLLDAASEGATLLAATGHPSGMLEHHIRVADAYVRAGGKLLRPREDERFPIGKRGRERRIRYVGGVGCVADAGALLHMHSADPMEKLLETKPWPDLVLGDHGFAGAAIERSIPTIAVMDINDHALAVAAAEGRDVIVIPMDDNRRPYLYEPVWTIFERILLEREQ